MQLGPYASSSNSCAPELAHASYTPLTPLTHLVSKMPQDAPLMGDLGLLGGLNSLLCIHIFDDLVVHSVAGTVSADSVPSLRTGNAMLHRACS